MPEVLAVREWERKPANLNDRADAVTSSSTAVGQKTQCHVPAGMRELMESIHGPFDANMLPANCTDSRLLYVKFA
jgi:hypothetical protein